MTIKMQDIVRVVHIIVAFVGPQRMFDVVLRQIEKCDDFLNC